MFCTTIKANSQKTFSSFVLCTNMVTMTSSEYGLYVNTTGQEFNLLFLSTFSKSSLQVRDKRNLITDCDINWQIS